MTGFEILVHAVRLAFVGGVGAVTYESPQNTGVAEKYTFIAIAAVIAVPILFGWIYTRITLRRFQKHNSAHDTKAGLGSDASGSTATMRQAVMNAQLARLLDMKSNPVIRLWWKRQDKLYNLNGGDNDLEAQLGDERRKVSAQTPRVKQKKEKHLKTGASAVTEATVDHPGDEQPSDPEVTKKKKEKKHKRDKESSNPLTEPGAAVEASIVTESKEKKHSKHKKHKAEEPNDNTALK